MTNEYYSYRFDTIFNGVFTSLSSNAHGSGRKIISLILDRI